MNYSSMKIIFHIIFYIRAVNNLIIIKFNLIFIYNKFFNNNNNKNNKLKNCISYTNQQYCTTIIYLIIYKLFFIIYIITLN